MSNEYVSVDGITIPSPTAAPIETFPGITAKHWKAWHVLMAEITEEDVRVNISGCLARAEGYALALLDSDLVTEAEHIQMGIEMTERATVRDWELQARNYQRK